MRTAHTCATRQNCAAAQRNTEQSNCKWAPCLNRYNRVKSLKDQLAGTKRYIVMILRYKQQRNVYVYVLLYMYLFAHRWNPAVGVCAHVGQGYVAACG